MQRDCPNFSAAAASLTDTSAATDDVPVLCQNSANRNDGISVSVRAENKRFFSNDIFDGQLLKRFIDLSMSIYWLVMTDDFITIIQSNSITVYRTLFFLSV